MARIVATSLVALLLVAGGFWLASRQPATAQSAEETAEPVDPGPQLPEGVTLPDGFNITPFAAEEPRQSFAGAEDVLEENTDYRAVIETSEGTMTIDLYEERTPETVNNFVFLALNRFYEGVVFHRVLEDFMAQTGDPTGTGRGGPGYEFEDEIVEGLGFDSSGLVAMANAGPGTNGSQFFITFSETPWLNGRHTIFGEVLEGADVLDSLQRIDPQTPSAIVGVEDPLSDLAEQGIELGGEPGATVGDYLTDTLGAMPDQGQTFVVDGYTGVVGRLEGETAIGFYPEPDFIENVYIVQGPKG